MPRSIDPVVVNARVRASIIINLARVVRNEVGTRRPNRYVHIIAFFEVIGVRCARHAQIICHAFAYTHVGSYGNMPQTRKTPRTLQRSKTNSERKCFINATINDDDRAAIGR